MDAVKSAEDKFASAVNEFHDAATLTEAADSLRDEAANVQAALSDLATEVSAKPQRFLRKSTSRINRK